MDSKQVQEILSKFPEPFDLGRIIETQRALYFIKDSETNTHHLIMGPYFLSDAYLANGKVDLNEDGKNEYGCAPEDAPLLLNTISWDAKGFGIWVEWKGKSRFRWLNLNLDSNGKLTNRTKAELSEFFVSFSDYKESLKELKTVLTLMGCDITPSTERMATS